jgi:hypothetical protein
MKMLSSPRKMQLSCGSDAYVATNPDVGVAPTKYVDDFHGILLAFLSFFAGAFKPAKNVCATLAIVFLLVISDYCANSLLLVTL